ncbi:hypothetical protein SERLADRAFT_461926 [Serpula lacrymans var. lacrymans S7.9]|uniref:Uncharacterized protein n=1 Tax=Serpula lacrymans var. lacrymans (strain S7.9) TaxID=578457 RepID=F8NM32_SERL9|nr:uncharacterized protein SERLADRAFT_461926 [Serpula lacrymans var. lacrymans S7.9]EGO27820.1 hypothetical protein SERLADRAFT_461926 [Serpula lacrymans var. lacrymans S7.9]
MWTWRRNRICLLSPRAGRLPPTEAKKTKFETGLPRRFMLISDCQHTSSPGSASKGGCCHLVYSSSRPQAAYFYFVQIRMHSGHPAVVPASILRIHGR